jgi:DNA-binding response OmpR family regulator
MPRILIADDNAPNAELLDAHLDGTGFETRTAADGDETLRAAKEWQPDLVLLDVMMPKVSGFEVCRRLRADPATARVGVLMITALDQPSDIDRAVDAGTDDFVTRPINKAELLLRVRALLAAVGEADPTARALTYLGRVQAGG